MAFFEASLPARLMLGSRGGPVWSTAVVKSVNGSRSTNREWSAPLHRYNVAPAIEDEADFEAIRAFFMSVGGQADGFRFRDRADYRAAETTSTLTYLTGTQWQLGRLYRYGARHFVRPIYKPAASPGVVVRRWTGAVYQTLPATVDTTTGIATVPGAAANDTLVWVGEFDVPVAFTSDMLETVIEDKAGDGQFLLRWPTIELEEIRNPT